MKAKTKANLFLFAIFTALFLCSCKQAALTTGGPIAKRGIRVINEDGEPMVGIPVSMSFNRQEGNVEGKTNTSGIFTHTARTVEGVGFRINIDGYYPSGGGLPDLKEVAFGRWQPWGKTDDVLIRKIINPIPMYAVKMIKIQLPELETPCGYDLLKGDWVRPWGQGTHGDIVFEAVSETRMPLDYYRKLKISFSNEGDGLIVVDHPNWEPRVYSSFQMDRYAPMNGYQEEYVIERHRNEDQVFKPGNLDYAYYFRVRTRLDRNGNTKEGYYGKIQEPFKIIPSGDNLEKISVRFGYYLNPNSNDPNLEFKKGSSLFSETGIYTEKEINEVHL